MSLVDIARTPYIFLSKKCFVRELNSVPPPHFSDIVTTTLSGYDIEAVWVSIVGFSFRSSKFERSVLRVCQVQGSSPGGVIS